MKDLFSGFSNIEILKKYKENNIKFVNNFRIIRTINKGNFSKVILCEKDSTLYTLKKYNKKFLEKKREIRRNAFNTIIYSRFDDLKEELKILNDINNQYCLTFQKIFTDYKNYIYILNDYFENESILKYDQIFFVINKYEHYFISLPVIKCIIKSVLEALHYIHKKNICHRDVKPCNILLNKNGKINLADFGEAQYMINKKIKGTKGTYEFMAPETFSQNISYDGEKVDIWSLGLCLYALFFRVLPYKKNESLIGLFNDIEKSDIKYFNKRNYFISEHIKDNNTVNNILSNEDINYLKCLLNKNPNERFSSEQALKHSWLSDVNYKHLENYATEIYEKKTKYNKTK